MQPVHHHQNCNELRGQDSGFVGDHNAASFIAFENLNDDVQNISLGCKGCCLAYLRERHYTILENMSIERVVFSNPAAPTTVACFLRRSRARRARNGQLATLVDPQLGFAVSCNLNMVDTDITLFF